MASRDNGIQILLLVGLSYGVEPSAVWAAEWSVLPSIGVRGVYNDNLLLTTLPHDATYGYWLSPAAEFSGKTERLQVGESLPILFPTTEGKTVNLPISFFR